MPKLKLGAAIETWPMIEPFRTAAHILDAVDVLLVSLEKDGRTGLGEAAGVYYYQDDPVSMLRQVEGLRQTIEAGIDRLSLQSLLPPGGARNALDCALWDLEAKLVQRPVWQLAGLEAPQRVLSLVTCGADAPEKMAAAAAAYEGARAIKLKLTGEPIDTDRVTAVREARPDVWLSVDGNQGFTYEALARLMPALVDAHVALIEQPFQIGQDALLDRLKSPIPVAADESVQRLEDIPKLVGRFGVVNIKLDKSGGLTEALMMARAAHTFGFDTWVGNMFGTSLAMAPAFLVAQLCSMAELDGPIFLKDDRSVRIQYADGYVECPEPVWGGSV